jgi:tRNA (cytidine56-2'-O)-methyltransferase
MEHSTLPRVSEKTVKHIAVLRWGHRFRDERLTTHVALTARAFGASEFILADVKDEGIKTAVEKVAQQWGGPFVFEMGAPWKETVKEWKKNGGIVVHLTVYGENIQTSTVLQRIKATGKNVLMIVGSQKVPSAFYSEKVSDFNVAVGNQPHSEVSSLAVFLDRLFEGRALEKEFKNWKIKVEPASRGKHVVRRL